MFHLFACLCLFIKISENTATLSAHESRENVTQEIETSNINVPDSEEGDGKAKLSLETNGDNEAEICPETNGEDEVVT